MEKILLSFILLRCIGVVVSFCVIDSKKGWWLDCGVRDSYLFRIKDFGGIQANFDLGIGIGDEKGFPNSISKTNQKASGISNYLPPPPEYHHGNEYPPVPHHQGYRRNDNSAYQSRRSDFPYQYELPHKNPPSPQTKQKKKKKSWWQRIWGGDSDSKKESGKPKRQQATPHQRVPPPRIPPQRIPQPVTPRYVKPNLEKGQTQKPSYQFPLAPQIPQRSPSLHVPVQRSKHMGSNEWTPISERENMPDPSSLRQRPGYQHYQGQPNSSPHLSAQNQQRNHLRGEEQQIDRSSNSQFALNSPNVYSYKHPSGSSQDFAHRTHNDDRLQYYDMSVEMLPPPPPPPHLRGQHRQDHFFTEPDKQFVFHAPAATTKPPPTVGPAMSDLLSVPADTSANTDNVPSFAAKMFIVREAPVEFYPPNYDMGRNRHKKRLSVEIPRTKFYCEDQKFLPGIYADAMLGCKMFHLCVPSSVGSTLTSYLCPNGTLFDQSILQCNHWYNVECESSVNDYDANLALALSYRRINAAHLPLHEATNADTLSLLSQNVNHMQVANPKNKLSKRMGRAVLGDLSGLGSQSDVFGKGSQSDVSGLGSQSDVSGQGSQSDVSGQGSQSDVSGLRSQSDVSGQGSQSDVSGQGSQSDVSSLGSQSDVVTEIGLSDSSQSEVNNFVNQVDVKEHSRESRELSMETISSNEVDMRDDKKGENSIRNQIILNSTNFEPVNNSVDIFGPGDNILKELIIQIQKQFRSKKMSDSNNENAVPSDILNDGKDNKYKQIDFDSNLETSDKGYRKITSNKGKIAR